MPFHVSEDLKHQEETHYNTFHARKPKIFEEKLVTIFWICAQCTAKWRYTTLHSSPTIYPYLGATHLSTIWACIGPKEFFLNPRARKKN